MLTARQLTATELEAGLETIRSAPKNSGLLEMIVRRPSVGARELLDCGELDSEVGLVGDTWKIFCGLTPQLTCVEERRSVEAARSVRQ